MPLLTILSLIGAALKIIAVVSEWMDTHPEVAADLRAKVDSIRVQTTVLSATVDDLREAHARVEAP